MNSSEFGFADPDEEKAYQYAIQQLSNISAESFLNRMVQEAVARLEISSASSGIMIVRFPGHWQNLPSVSRENDGYLLRGGYVVRFNEQDIVAEDRKVIVPDKLEAFSTIRTIAYYRLAVIKKDHLEHETVAFLKWDQALDWWQYGRLPEKSL